MYCSHCGVKIEEEDARFCPACGEQLSVRGLADGAAKTAVVRPRVAMWKKVLIAVGLFIAMVIGLALWATAPLIPPIEAQLEHLRNDRIEAAYNATSRQFQASTSLEEFTAFIGKNPVLKQISDTSFASKEWENDLGKVRGTLTASDGTVIPVLYRLVKEDGEWKILAISFNPEAE